MFGSDFWKILRLIIAIFKLFAENLGSEDDKKEMADNGFS